MKTTVSNAAVRQVECPQCGAGRGEKCSYRLPPESPWYTGKREFMHTGAHAERFTAAGA